MSTDNNVALITMDDISKVDQLALNEKQIEFLLKPTPEKYIKELDGRGGNKFDYVTGGYIKKMLNLAFGYDWDFVIKDHGRDGDEVWVLGRLICRTSILGPQKTAASYVEKTIIKEQFGKKDVVYLKKKSEDGSRVPVSIGNDMKAAATDALKKCASELGIAADVYNKDEFTEVSLVNNEDIVREIRSILDDDTVRIAQPDRERIEKILLDKEVSSYSKALRVVRHMKKNQNK